MDAPSVRGRVSFWLQHYARRQIRIWNALNLSCRRSTEGLKVMVIHTYSMYFVVSTDHHNITYIIIVVALHTYVHAYMRTHMFIRTCIHLHTCAYIRTYCVMCSSFYPILVTYHDVMVSLCNIMVVCLLGAST